MYIAAKCHPPLPISPQPSINSTKKQTNWSYFCHYHRLNVCLTTVTGTSHLFTNFRHMATYLQDQKCVLPSPAKTTTTTKQKKKKKRKQKKYQQKTQLTNRPPSKRRHELLAHVNVTSREREWYCRPYCPLLLPIPSPSRLKIFAQPTTLAVQCLWATTSQHRVQSKYMCHPLAHSFIE